MRIRFLVCAGVIVLCGPLGCADPDKAKRTLEEAGYKHVQLTGPRWWGILGGCPRGSGGIGQGFTATDKHNAIVTGKVCPYLFLQPSVHFD